jgi:polysaccharide export outer membrane protein
MKHGYRTALPLLLALAWGGLAGTVSAASAAGTTGGPGAEEPQAEGRTEGRTEGSAAGEYVIGIGDVVEIAVWKNPELTVTVPVRPDGRISVPLLGDVAAAGLTPLALKLGDGLRQYITAPAVSVVIKEINSQKIFITGEVAKPAAYDLRPHTRLMQALALAGGLTPFAKGRVVVLREQEGKNRRFELTLSGIVKGRHPEDNILLQAGDTLIFP